MSSAAAELRSVLQSDDVEFVESFITDRARTSTNSAKVYKSAVIRFLTYVGKRNIIDITRKDAEDYLGALDQMITKKRDRRTGLIEYHPVTLAYKQTQYQLVNSFLESYADQIYETNPTYRKPIPSLRRFRFSPDEAPTHAEIQQKIKEAHPTPEKVLEILKTLYYSASNKYVRGNKEYFMISLLQTMCGMRISECIATRIADVNLIERFLITARVKGALKNNKTGRKPLYFCFPEEVAYLLNEYIRDLQKRCPNVQWLFPGIDPSRHIHVRSVQDTLANLGIDLLVKTHSFRKTMEYLQAEINEVPLHFVEMLSNHQITSIVMRHYAEAPFEERRAKYDKYLPPQFQIILSWLKTL